MSRRESIFTIRVAEYIRGSKSLIRPYSSMSLKTCLGGNKLL